MKCKYSAVQVFLHWISAVVIIWATISGFWVALFTPPLQYKEYVAFINVSLTTLFIPLFMVRMWFAITRVKPRDSLLTYREERLASLGHTLLYINITIVMITGILMMERPINVFNWFELPQPINNPVLTSALNRAHVISCITLGLLVTGHILAVIKHQLQGKRLLRRMGW